MGASHQAACRACGHTFSARIGGGWNFILVRCTECGRSKTLDRPAQPQPDNAATGPANTANHPANNKTPGRCQCGGEYTEDAPVRCPQCKSTDIEIGEPDILYD